MISMSAAATKFKPVPPACLLNSKSQSLGCVAGVAGVVGVVWLVCLMWWVFGMAYRYRTEPKLRNTGNTHTAKHRICIGIDRTARLQP